MAINLFVECGDDEAGASALASHFEASSQPVSASAYASDSGHWWVRAGGADLAALFDRLRESPGAYRFALPGDGPNAPQSYDELIEAGPGEARKVSGLVVSMETWEWLEGPTRFVPFTQGYRWMPLDS